MADSGPASVPMNGVKESGPTLRVSASPSDMHLLDKDARPCTFIMIGELLAEPDDAVAYVVDGMLVTAGTSLLVAKPKVGKTTFVENLAVSVARGTSFLTRLTQPGLVLYLALEEKPSEVRRAFQALGVEKHDQVGLFMGSAPQHALDWLGEEIMRRRPTLVIIDTVQRFLRLSDLNDYAVVSNALEPVTNLARESGAHIMMTHHGNKSGGSDGDAVLGSTALFGSVDTLIEIRRRDARRTALTDQRYGENLEESLLEFDPITRELSIGGSKATVDADAAARAICAYLDRVSEPVDQKTLWEAVGGNHATRLSALGLLVERGDVRREGSGVKGSPFVYSRTHLYRGVHEYGNLVADVPVCGRCGETGTTSPDGEAFCTICELALGDTEYAH